MNQSERQIPTLSNEFIVRLIGGVFMAIILGIFGAPLADYTQQRTMPFIILLGLLGFLAGIILTPYFTTRPLRRIRNSLVNMPPERLVAVLLGMLTGLLAGGLFSIPLSFLPSPFREITPLASVIVLSYLSSIIFMLRQNDLRAFVSLINPTSSNSNNLATQARATAGLPDENYILLDTSVIIDGRITDVSKTGFIRATLLIPSFILRELQYIADSADHLRRNRGRRGLDVLGILRDESPIPVRITDMDTAQARDADSKLVVLAKELHCPIMTNDYNLNRVAELQGVTVLNINDLANAVKAAYLPGEDVHVRIIQEGREMGQGIGYLEDGTMVVVEDGIQRLNQQVHVLVTKVLQTSAGRMVFARFATANETEGRRNVRER